MEELQVRLQETLAKIAEVADQPLPDGALQPTVPYELLGDHDVMVRVDIRVFSKAGEEFRVTGLNTAPHILSDEAHPEAPHLFNDLFTSTIARPTLSRFSALLNTRTKRDDQEPRISNQTPTLSLETKEESEEPVIDKGFLADI